MKHADERGVTLLELLFVVAILVMVTSAAIAFIDMAYDSYSDNSKRSQNQQQATTALNRLTQDIREAQPEDEAIQVERKQGSDQVTITKRPDSAATPVTVRYERLENGSLVYLRDTSRPDEGIVLADFGTLSVKREDGAYQVKIIAGEGADSITLDTSVARYDWGR